MKWIDIYILFSGWFFPAALLCMVAGLVLQVKTVVDMSDRIENVSFHRRSFISQKKSPFGKIRWSLAGRSPLLGITTFIFHLFLISVPLFISGHTVLLYRAMEINFPALPGGVGDVITLLVLVSGGLLLGRRIFSPSIRFLSSTGDYFMMIVALGPFVTGYFACHYIGDYEVVMALHAVSGNLFLIALGWTRLGHFVFNLYSRFFVRGEHSLVGGTKRWSVGNGDKL